MAKLKFGTDGWRAIIAKEYTTENVARISLGVVSWLKKNKENPAVVLGHDCRFGGELFAETVAKVLASSNIKVYLAKGIITTPIISYTTKELNADLGIVITASHNPPSYNGYKLKASFGGALPPAEVQEIEDLIPDLNTIDIDSVSIEKLVEKGTVAYTDLEQMYFDRVEAEFDMEAIRNAENFSFAYDAMYGSGQKLMRRLMPDITFLHCEENPGFNGTPPEPILRNLQEFSDVIRLAEGEISSGLVTDGDADRIGLFGSSGNYIDSHHIILLSLKYLVEVKKYTGKVILAFSVSPKAIKLCEHYGLEYEVVKIGFKHVAALMVKEDALLGGEESGGVAIKGHIPERDGIWMGLTIWEYMVKSGKSIEQLIQEIYDIVGPFAYDRMDAHIPEEDKIRIMRNCAEGKYKKFGDYKVERVEDIDGYKYHLENEQWLMIRPSGTEPVLRIYAGGETLDKAKNIIQQAHQTLLNKA